jgi:hypothetical protein
VVDRPQDARRLYSKMTEEPESDSGFHNFLTVGQIVKKGWQAEFILGSDEGKTLAEMLHYQPMTGQLPVMGRSLMNTSKSPYKTKNYKIFAATDFSDFCY